MIRFSTVGLLGLVVTGCGSTSTGGVDSGSLLDAGVSSAQVNAVLTQYATHLASAYGDAVTDTQALATSVDALIASPSETTLTAARTAWLASRAHYMLVEGARFYGGPIDLEPPNHEASINSWPLDEAYVDYATSNGVADETVGLINHPELMPTINVEAIDAANAQGGDTNISDGYHVIEFLLWGQALAEVGPGTRPATDYVVNGPRQNATRRGQYLKAAVQGVLTHLTAVRDAWAPGAMYRTQFEAGGLQSVGLAFTGLGRMSKGELAGQRMQAAYASKSRRDQHDCFSSQTLVDYTRDAQGLNDLYVGTYGTSTGASLSDLVKAVNPTLDARLRAQLQTSITAMASIPAPFESAIQGADDSAGRTAIRATVTSLRTQGENFAEAAQALGLTISVPDQN